MKKLLPILILLNLAVISLFFSFYRENLAQPSNPYFSIETVSGHEYIGLLTDSRTKDKYPIFDMMDPEGKHIGLGFEVSRRMPECKPGIYSMIGSLGDRR